MRYKGIAIKFDRVEIAFVLALFYWLNQLLMKEGIKPEYPEKTPGDELQKMPHKWSPKNQAPSKIGTRTIALVAG